MPYQPDLQLPATTPGGLATGVDGERLAAPSEQAARRQAEDDKNREKNEQEKRKVSGPKNPTRSGKVLRYPAKPALIESSTDYVMFQFFEYSPPFKADADDPNSTINTIASYNASANEFTASELPTILLYMPEDISTGHKANWNGKNFSNIGAGIMKVAGGITAVDKLSQALTGLDNAATNFVPLAGAQIVNAAIGKITGESVSLDEFFGGTRGVILNPNSELLFSGLDMRNFTLNYKLVPRNSDEAKQVDQIIRTFKKGMLPYGNSNYTDPGGTFLADVVTLGIGGTGNLSANYIKVPDVCRVSFMRGGALNPDVPQYKTCALTQVDVSYTPDGTYAITEEGKMVAYQLSLSFQETKLVFREEIQDSGASY